MAGGLGVCMVGGMCGRGACVARRHVWQRGCVYQGGVHGRGACVAGGHAWQGRRGVHGRGHAWQGVCMGGGHVWQGWHTWQILRDKVNERLVHILLECILVMKYFTGIKAIRNLKYKYNWLP